MKDILTTGEAAKILMISQQSVIRAIDGGLLKAHRVPGSRFRRVQLKDLVEFMVENGLPLTNLACTLFVVGGDVPLLAALRDVLPDARRFPIREARALADALVELGKTASGAVLVNARSSRASGALVAQMLYGSLFPRPTYHILAYNAEGKLGPHISTQWDRGLTTQELAQEVRNFLREKGLAETPVERV